MWLIVLPLMFKLSPPVVFKRSNLPTLTTSRLPRDPSSQRWNYVGEKWPMNFAWNARLPRSIQESFICRKSTTWDRRLYFPSEGRRAEDFFAQKNPTASAGFEPTNLGTKVRFPVLEHRNVTIHSSECVIFSSKFVYSFSLEHIIRNNHLLF